MDLTQLLSKISDIILSEAGILALIQFIFIVYLAVINHNNQKYTRELNSKIYELGVAYTQAMSDITSVLDSLMTLTRKSHDIFENKK